MGGYSGKCFVSLFVLMFYVPVSIFHIHVCRDVFLSSCVCFVLILYVPVNDVLVMSGHFTVSIRLFCSDSSRPSQQCFCHIGTFYCLLAFVLIDSLC